MGYIPPQPLLNRQSVARSHKKYRLRLVIALIIGLILVSGIYTAFNTDRVIGNIPFYGYCYEKNKFIKASSERDQATLNKLTIVSGQKTAAKVRTNGDCIDGSSDDTSVSADFYGSGAFAPVVADVQHNLMAAGYGTPSKLNIGEGAAEVQVTSLTQSFTKGKESIVVTYTLATPFTCPLIPNVTASCSSSFDIQLIANQTLSMISVSYVSGVPSKY